MNLFSFECINCGYEIKKINSIKDIFLVKTGKEIKCNKCSTVYTVPKTIAIVSKIYYYSLLSGFVPLFILLSLNIFLGNIIDNVFGYGYANYIGIWMWLFSVILYIFIELIVVVLVPIKKKD